jgi:endo-1,4-beta-xylanase
VRVQGQPFTRALQIQVLPISGPRRDVGLVGSITQPVRKGDVLWLSFAARRLTSTRETGEAAVELRFDQLLAGQYLWPPHLERGLSFGPEWTETSIPLVMTKDAGIGDVRLVFRFDDYPQQWELGPITFVNHGPNARMEDLPRSTVRYGGDAPDAPWREAAAARIEQHRNGNLTVSVVDAAGRPVPGARVSARMTRLAYHFGTAIASKWLLDEPNRDAQHYRAALQRYFNQVVFDNEMKWPHWASPTHSPLAVQRALDWLDQQQIPARGHVMVWPSWRYVPKAVQALRDDPPALGAAVLDHIRRQTGVMRGRFAEWDVTNELYAHHDVIDLLGREALVDWYQAAHEGDPHTRLFYNEYTMFHAEPAASHFFDTVKFLRDHGAPLHGIGEQAHIGGSPPSIPLVIERLDRFAALGLPIIITEFDINSDDDDFKASYLRDFMTAVFSHPATTGILQWGFWEGHHWFPVAALWNQDWTLRPHGRVFTELIEHVWRTDFDGTSGPDGTARLRAFCGEYLVRVQVGNRTVELPVTVTPDGSSLRVQL